MTDPAPELEERIRLAFARIAPDREFHGCKVSSEEDGFYVRIYSRALQAKRLMPIPHQVYRFDPVASTLSVPTQEEAQRFAIPNYK